VPPAEVPVPTPPTSQPLSETALRAAIDAVPRVRLAQLPTPLEELPRLREALGGPTVAPRILVKRDDQTGLALGGNKTRMFEFVIASAVDQGADVVVGGAAVHSNYARQLAAACAKVGLECHLVLRRVRGERDREIQGALLLDLIVGAHVQLIEDDRSAQTAALNELAERLEAEGRRVFRALLASEESKWLQSLAYVDAVLELLGQARTAGIAIDRIYAPTLEATHAGIRLGLTALGSSARFLAVSPNEASIWPGRTVAEETARAANEVAGKIGIPTRLDPANVELTMDYVGEAYGAVTVGGQEAMRLFGRTEALLLDPVYTAKAAAAMIDHIRRGMIGPDETVVFWHTGGLPAIFAYAGELGFDAPPDYVPGTAAARG
jgi:1-aminocyclopropane-1-carboxylate deaminase/D-cysteine desulfhydrase-like pyridoxal-dependent ACC family enzyme